MRRSTHGLEGSPGFNFQTRKLENGRYEITTSAAPERKWEGEDETDAMRTASAEMRDAMLRGEL